MSSLQIYNIKNNLEKTDLEYLTLFSEYKKVTEKLLKKSYQFEVIKKQFERILINQI